LVRASDQNLGHLEAQAAQELLRQTMEHGAQANADATLAAPGCDTSQAVSGMMKRTGTFMASERNGRSPKRQSGCASSFWLDHSKPRHAPG
jgi:hypothetical protein